MPGPPLVIPNTIQVRLLWALSGQLGVNVLHGTVGALAVTQGLAETVGAAIKSSFSSTLAAHFNSSNALVRVGLRDLRNPNMTEFLDTGALIGGSHVADALPTQNAACITLRTASSGKSFRGRVYISGFTEDDNDVNGLTASAGNIAAANFLIAVQANLLTNGITLAVASRPAEEKILTETTNHVDGTTTVRTLSHQTAKSGQSTRVTAIVVRDANWQSQRRRSNGRGLPPTFTEVFSHTL